MAFDFIYKTKEEMKIGKSTDPAFSDLSYGFSTRSGGVSNGALFSLNLGVNRPDSKENLAENYRRFSREAGIDDKNLILPRQIHSDRIISVTGKDAGKGLRIPEQLECDGLITTEANLPIGIFFADCTPVLLYAPESHCLCVVHCGWKGTVAGLAGKGADRMEREFHCKKKEIHAIIGPCIGVCHFEVGREVADAFVQAGQKECVYPGKMAGKFFVDLKKANWNFLKEAGVPEQQITVAEECTVCRTDLFFSHRGCGPDTGRMAMAACIKE